VTRRLWVLVHRYAGLYLALFLAVAGLTGSVMAFHPEVSRWLDPPPPCPEARGRAPLDPLVLRERALALEPQGTLAWIPLHLEAGEVFAVRFQPRTDPATGKPRELAVTAAWLDPYTGEALRQRRDPDGFWPLTRQNLLPFLVALHYSLAAGQVGTWLFGIAALVWTLDCFVGLYLTFPARRREPVAPSPESARRSWLGRWKVSWLVKWQAGPWRLGFDLHRAPGLWTWVLLLAFAWSGVGFNLYEQVYVPVSRALLGWEDPWSALPKLAEPQPEPALGWREARETGRRLLAEQAAAAGARVEHEESLGYDPEKAVFYYGARTDREILSRGSGTAVLVDASSGALRGVILPRGQGLGASVHAWIFGIHTATVFGLAGQLGVLVMGLVVAQLSLTGLYLWWKKRRFRGRAGAGPPA
jgi:uncharacterized iron-regulated membrane protein